jgi:hypothetical protein
MRWKLVYGLRDVVVAPRSFVRPRPLEIAPPLDVGATAPELERGPAVVAFLRHVGCPFAEATLRALAAAAEGRPELRFVAVTHSAPEVSVAWVEACGGAPGVWLVADPRRSHYAAWGVGLCDRRHLAGRESREALFRLLDGGIHNRWPSGNRWQSAATFGVDGSGIVRWRHLPRHAGDLPPLDEATRALVG